MQKCRVRPILVDSLNPTSTHEAMRAPKSLLCLAFLLVDVSFAYVVARGVDALQYSQFTTLRVRRGVPSRNSRSEKLHLRDTFPQRDEDEPDPETLSCKKCSKRCKRPKFYLDEEACKCKNGPSGTKVDPALKVCVPDTNNQPDEDTKGKCKDGMILDPAEGGQDKKTENPKCIQDDKKLCEKGEVPQSRAKDDTSTKKKGDVRCGKDIPEDEKPKCKKSEYRFVDIDLAGNAKYSCKKTRKFDREKKSKFEDAKKRKKADYDKKKQDKDKKAKEEKDNRKKERMGKCLCIVPLTFIFSQSAQFAWSVNFFDKEFVGSDGMMQYWPSDMDDVPDFDKDIVNTEDYIDKFLQAVNNEKWTTEHGGGPGGHIAKIRSPSTESDAFALVPSETGLVVHDHERRQASAGGVVGLIVAFAIRIGSRLGPAIRAAGQAVSRLKALEDKGGPRIAEAGKSTATRKQQQDAAAKTSSDKNWKNCLKGLQPV